LPRYGDFSTFQDGGRRAVGFLKFEIFNGQKAQEGRTASPRQIWSKSVKTPGPRSTSVPSGILMHPAVWPPKIGDCAPFWGAESPSNTMSAWPRPTSVPSDILIHPAVWPQLTWAENWEGAMPSICGLGPHVTQSRVAESYLHTKWHLNLSSRLATTDMAENWRPCPFLGRGARSPPNTVWPGPSPTSMPSFVLIRPTV